LHEKGDYTVVLGLPQSDEFKLRVNIAVFHRYEKGFYRKCHNNHTEPIFYFDETKYQFCIKVSLLTLILQKKMGALQNLM